MSIPLNLKEIERRANHAAFQDGPDGNRPGPVSVLLRRLIGQR